MDRRKRWLHRLRRLTTWLVIAGVVLLALGNLVLNTPWVKGRLEGLLSRMQGGQEVEISRAWWIPFAGLHLDGIRLGKNDDGQATRVGAFVFYPKWSTLPTRQVEMKRIVVDRLEILLTAGDLIADTNAPPAGAALNPQLSRIPLTPEAPPSPKKGNEPLPPVDPRETPIAGGPTDPDFSSPGKTAPGAPSPANPSVTPGPTSREAKDETGHREWIVQNFEIRRGRISIDHGVEGAGELTVRDLEIELTRESETTHTGKFSIEAIKNGGRTIASGIRSPVKFEKTAFTLTRLTGTFGGGALRGVALADLRYQGAPYRLEIECENVDVPSLLPAATIDAPAELIAGKAKGRLSLRGLISRIGSSAFQGAAEIEGAVVEFDAGFDHLASMVNVDEEGRANLDDWRLIVTGVNQQCTIHDATAASGRLLGKARGYADLDGRMILSTRLYVDRSTSEGILFESKEGRNSIHFLPLVGTDWVYHDFRVVRTDGEPLADFLVAGSFMPLPEIVRRLGSDLKRSEFAEQIVIQPRG